MYPLRYQAASAARSAGWSRLCIMVSRSRACRPVSAAASRSICKNRGGVINWLQDQVARYPPRLHQLHAPQIQFLVAPVGPVQRAAGLGKGRRIAQHQAETPAFLAVRLHQVKHIGTGGGDAILHPVLPGVLPHQLQGGLGRVHRLHCGRPVQRRVNGEAPGVAAQVQDRPPGAVGADAAPVFLLVQEVAGFLALPQVRQHLRVVLHKRYELGHMAVNAAGDQGQALLLSNGHVVPLKDTQRMQEFRQKLHQVLLPGLQSQADDLKREVIPELVHSKARQAVGIPKDHPAGARKAQSPAILPGLGQTPLKKARSMSTSESRVRTRTRILERLLKNPRATNRPSQLMTSTTAPSAQASSTQAASLS